MAVRQASKSIIALCVFGDALLFHAASILTFLVRYGGIPIFNFQPYLLALPFLTLALLLIFNFFGLYKRPGRIWSETLAALIVSLGFIFFVTVAFFYMFYGFSYPRLVLLIAPLVQLLLLGAWRWAIWRWELRRRPLQRLLIIAPQDELEKLGDKSGAQGYQIAGTIAGDRANAAIAAEQAFITSQPDGLLVSGRLPEAVKEELLRMALAHHSPVYLIPDLYEIMLAASRTEQIDDTMVFALFTGGGPGREQLKRGLDIVLAIIGLLITFPLLILIAIGVKLTSRGPIIFSQERLGWQGRPFLLHKFRTMAWNAEAETGPVLSNGAGDSRVTRVGRILRSTRLDEIPQLYNVLRGEMSIVGPRPERAFFVKRFEAEIPEYAFRHLMKPGLTGLAQVSGKYSTTVEDKLRFDLLYGKDASPFLDLKIILQTIKVLLIREKAE